MQIGSGSRNGRRNALALLASTAALLASALTWAAQADAAPGNPGVPGPPVTVFTEDFENVGNPAQAEFLDAYTGATGMTYTAHPNWISGPACNGIIAAWNTTTQTTPACAFFNSLIRPLARGLGGVLGGGDDNQAMADVTVSGFPAAPTPAATLETEGLVSLPSTNRFVTFSVAVGAVGCTNPADPLLRWFLLDGGTALSATNDAVNACTDPRGAVTPDSNGIRVGTYPSDSSILVTNNQIGLRLTNDQTSGSGNDYAVDDVRVLDATPQLDKEFGADTFSGEPTTLTFTITNTDELAAKRGWSFTDTLPAGLTVADPTEVTTNCTNGAISATAGGGAIDVSGDLDAEQAFCTATVSVVSPTPGTFENCPADITNVVGLDLPACDQLIVGPSSDLELVKTATPDAPSPGDTLTYTLTATNLGPDASPGATVTDTLPTGLSPLNSPCTVSAQEISCTVGAQGIGPGDAETFTVTAYVNPGAESTVQTNAASVDGQNHDPNPDNDTDSVSTPIPPIADLSITKSASPDPAKAGADLIYTLNVANAGPTDSVVRVTDTLPAGLVYDDAASDSRCEPGAGQDVVCELTLLDDGNATLTIVAAVPAGTTGSLENNAAIASTDNPNTAGTVDPVPERDSTNNTAQITTQIALPPSPPADTPPADTGGSRCFFGNVVTILGTNGPDRIVGTPGRDVINGLRGKDVILGLDGDDLICGGRGDDLIKGGNGDDRVKGSKGDDRIIGNKGDDWLRGAQGDDVITGRSGNDRLMGNRGDDILRGKRGNDFLLGGPGRDKGNGGPGRDRARGLTKAFRVENLLDR